MTSSCELDRYHSDVLTRVERGQFKMHQLMRGHVISLRPGQLMIRANARQEYVYQLMDGWACRMRPLNDGQSQLLLIFLPGDFFGVRHLFSHFNPNSVMALSPVTVTRIERRILYRAFVEDADIASRCLWQLMEDDRRLNNSLVSLGRGHAEERLAMLLVDFRNRLVACGKIEETDLSYEIPLTQSNIGDLLGLTPVHVNRVLKQLREQSVVCIRSGVVTIQDWNGLVERAQPLLDEDERSRVRHCAQLLGQQVNMSSI